MRFRSLYERSIGERNANRSAEKLKGDHSMVRAVVVQCCNSWILRLGDCMKTNEAARRVPRLLLIAILLAGCALAQPAASISATHSGKNEFVIKNATLLTATHGRIEHGSVYVKDGKIVAFGANVSAPAAVTVIDADGKYVTPGIIDPHSHMALDGDVNEATNPVVPQMMMKDAFEYTDKAIYRALAGGVTTSLLLHGSADMIGGQARGDQNQVRPRPRPDAVSGRAAVHQVRQRRKS